MHDAAALLIALIFLVVSFFVALIAPKGKRKLLWLFVWFMVFFGDIVVLKAIMAYYDFKYAKINIYEKPAITEHIMLEKEK